MNIFKWFKRKKRFDLRQACIDKYGNEFGDMYDAINRGESIGGFIETATFINMLEEARKEIA